VGRCDLDDNGNIGDGLWAGKEWKGKERKRKNTYVLMIPR
jgi:hypothetical protein